MATNARMRLYDELLPRLERALSDLSREAPTPEAGEPAIVRVKEAVSAVRRTSALAGLGGDKAVPLVGVEPLHGSNGHVLVLPSIMLTDNR